MRSLQNVMRTACVMQASPVMHAFGACRNASYHLSQRSGITYHLFANLITSQHCKGEPKMDIAIETLLSYLSDR